MTTARPAPISGAVLDGGFVAGEVAFALRCELTPAGPRSRWVAGSGPAPSRPLTHDPLADLAAALDSQPSSATGGWVLMLSYDLGRILEPRAASRSLPTTSAWPLLEAHWIPRLAPAPLPESAERPPALHPSPGARERYVSSVVRTIEYIRAGDCYQANLAHPLRADWSGDPRPLAGALLARTAPRHGAYMELPDAGSAILSLSPELFLSIRAHKDGARAVTRPMKGTRPATGSADELRASPKDRAELNMIIDLMRNDLGRVCAIGTVRVEDERHIRAHKGGVIQAEGVVSGLLRPDLHAGAGIAALLRATFPPGSVTGAPKIRAMQIIDELEEAPRGPYCGAIGLLRPSASPLGWDLDLAVAIRTLLLAPGRATYWVGAGIVADSDPAQEWAETIVKAAAVGVPPIP